MIVCVRTTLNIDDELMTAAKHRAVAQGRTLTSVVEDALRAALTETAGPRVRVTLPVFGGDGAAAGVDLSDPRALGDLMYDEEDARYRAVFGDAAP